MEPSKTAKKAASVLADAIKTAINANGDVAHAMADLRALGYEPNVRLRLDLEMAMDAGEQLTDRRFRLA